MTADNSHNDGQIEYPYEDLLDEESEALYWSATEGLENAFATIAEIDGRRKNGDRTPEEVIISNDIGELREEIQKLEMSLITLHALEIAAALAKLEYDISDDVGMEKLPEGESDHVDLSLFGDDQP